MSMEGELNSEAREILGPAENRETNKEEHVKKTQKKYRNKEVLLLQKKKKPEQKLVFTGKPKIVVKKKNVGDDQANGVVKVKSVGGVGMELKKKRVKKAAKIVPDGMHTTGSLSPGPIRRCDWITPNSEPLYIQFHDEEWGVPVRDDKKLFELLILSQALTELTWPTILYNRESFRMMFEDFDPSSVAKYDEQKLRELVQNGNMLSEPKLRAVVDNAIQFMKIQQEFNSFSNYCWRFVNNKQIKSGYRYARQVPAKTPKSELISKDLMRRGFRYVGPTIMYSFMQVAGLVNDHLTTCSRFSECDNYAKMDPNIKLVKTDGQGKATINICSSNDS